MFEPTLTYLDAFWSFIDMADVLRDQRLANQNGPWAIYKYGAR